MGKARRKMLPRSLEAEHCCFFQYDDWAKLVDITS